MNPLELVTGNQQAAVVAAACATGVADAIAEGPREPEAVAAACGTDPRGTRSLLGGLAALGLADHGPGGYVLSADGAALARDHPGVGGPDRGQGVVLLPGLGRAGRLLEVGGGAGSHAAALARAVPGLKATVLDLPAVEPVVAERHPELGFVAGDLDRPRFGRPAAERWDVVLLANVLHDHPAGRARRSWPPRPACSPPAAPCSSTSGCPAPAATVRPRSPCSTS